MDPLSITASIIAILGAGEAIAQGIRKLVVLRDAPSGILQLNNELSDLRLVIVVVQDVHEQHYEFLGTRSPHSAVLYSALKNTQVAVQDLDALIQYGLPKATIHRGIDWIAWMREGSKIQKMNARLRSARMDITAATSILSLSSAKHLEIHCQKIHLHIEDLVRQDQITKQLMQAVLQSTNQGSAQFFSTQKSAEDSKAHTNATPQNVLFSHPSRVCASQSPVTSLSSPQYPNGPVRFDFTYTRISCSFCTCSCHKQSQWRSPRMLNGILGSVFVGYNSWPFKLTIQRCDLPSCQSKGVSTFKIMYIFPLRFIQRTLMVKIRSKGPELLLRIQRIRPRNAAIFVALENNNTEVVRNLLTAGDASILDVNEDGQSLLHCSLGRYWPTRDLLNLLLEAGGDIMQEDNSFVTPYMDIWKYHLADSPARRGYDFFDDKPQIDLFGFSHLHFAVLGLDGTMFDTALSSASRLSVNGKDAMGRTALFWAALRGDITIVKKLLLKGADPDISDNRGSTPLHCAVTESPGQIIETLICAGADVNMTDCLGRTVLMELIRCREFEVEILQKLFEAGPHADSHSGQHQEPAKAVQQPYVRMHSSMSRNRPVQNDGRVDSRAVYDRTPLMSTNGRKNYEILKHLLQAGADYTFLDIEDRSILHIAADYGDLKTLAVLRQANLEYLWPDGKNKHGYKPMDIAIWRRDDNAGWSRWAIREPTVDPQEWFAAFEDLYLSIKCSHDKAYTERTRNTGKGANNKEPEVMKASTQIPL